jgi:hypothetical protein
MVHLIVKLPGRRTDRALELCIRRGGTNGREFQDWIEAEYQSGRNATAVTQNQPGLGRDTRFLVASPILLVYLVGVVHVIERVGRMLECLLHLIQLIGGVDVVIRLRLQLIDCVGRVIDVGTDLINLS